MVGALVGGICLKQNAFQKGHLARLGASNKFGSRLLKTGNVKI